MISNIIKFNPVMIEFNTFFNTETDIKMINYKA